MVIRPTKTIDAHSISRVYVQTWRDTYLSVVPYGYLLEMSESRHEKEFLNDIYSKQVISFVAEDAGKIIGFTTGGRERYGDKIYSGEIYTLYVLKNFQGQGIGTELVSALARQLTETGIYSMLVRVLKLNPYRKFYRKINGILLTYERQRFSGETVEVEVYGWPDTGLMMR